MQEFGILSFRYGLDTRRDVLTSQPGTLVTCENAHVNPGGEIEKRKKFDIFADVSMVDSLGDPGTFGLEVTEIGKVVFGSALSFGTTPTQSQPTLADDMPEGVTYQQLKHPSLVNDTATKYDRSYHRITAIRFSDNFNGKTFVAALFSDGRTYLYYDGSLVQQSANGMVLEGRTGLDDLSDDLARQINAIDWLAIANKAGNPLQVASITRVGTTATATVTGHGFSNGDSIEIVGAVQAVYNGLFTISNVTANTFDYTIASDPGVNATTATNILAIKHWTTENGSTQVESPALDRFTIVPEDTSSAGQIGVNTITQDGQRVAGTKASAAFQITVNTGTFTVEAPQQSTADTPRFDLCGGAIAAQATAKLTADAITAAINDLSFIHGYAAVASSDTVTVYAPESFGSFTFNLHLTTTTGTVAGVAVSPAQLNAQIIRFAPSNIIYLSTPQPRNLSVVVDCTVSGGSPPYSFSWTELTPGSGNGIQISGGASPSATFSKLLTAFGTVRGDFKCTVRDSVGAIDVATVVVTLGMLKI